MATQQLATEAPTDEPTPKHVLSTVYSTLRDAGYQLPTADSYESRMHDDLPPETAGVPDFMVGGNGLAEAVRTGFMFPFSWSEAVEGAGTTGGSAHFTTTYVRCAETVESATEHLVETGQFDAATAKIRQLAENADADPVEVTAYAVATYAKGWVAEQLLTASDRFSKGSQSNDEAGQDAFDRQRGDYVQIKCVTHDSQKPDHVYYQWDMRGGIHYGDDLREVAHAAGEVSGRVGDARRKGVEIGVTQTIKNRRNRNRRLIWW